MKHAGDLVAAASLADEARCMDLADRYINSESVKRMLQADQVLKLFSPIFCHFFLFVTIAISFTIIVLLINFFCS